MNPAHLEPVTAAENSRRSTAAEATRERARQSTHCPNGHAYDADNIYVDSKGRNCLKCKKAAARAWYERNRELTIQRAAEWSRANPDRAREVARQTAARRRAKKKAA